jgi:hypothetical protein
MNTRSTNFHVYIYVNYIHVHNFNKYLCKHNVRKKEIWYSTFCERQNANDRKMIGISAFGALVASIFTNTTSLDSEAKTCLSSFKCNRTRYIVWVTVSSITNISTKNEDDLMPFNSKVPSCHVMSTSTVSKSPTLPRFQNSEVFYSKPKRWLAFLHRTY